MDVRLEALRTFAEVLSRFEEELKCYTEEGCDRRKRGRPGKSAGQEDSDLNGIMKEIVLHVQPLRDLLTKVLNKKDETHSEVDGKVEVKQELLDWKKEEDEDDDVVDDLVEEDPDLDLPFVVYPDMVEATTAYSDSNPSGSYRDSDQEWSPECNLQEPLIETTGEGPRERQLKLISKRYPKGSWPSIKKDPTGQFYCPESNCGKMSKTKAVIVNHMYRVHPELRQRKPLLAPTPKRKRTDTCAACGRKFSNFKERVKHEKAHELEGGKAFQCDHCPAAFDRKEGLQQHASRYHLGRTYVCDKCGKECTSNPNLMKHMTDIHLQVKPFRCEQCPSAFRDKAKLKLHVVRIHINKGTRRIQAYERRKEQEETSSV